MIIKELISRIVHKSDVEKRWQLAVDFVPLKGEIIIYDRDDNIEDEAFKGTHSYARFKIGDGVTKVNELPFANSSNFIGPDSPDSAPDGSFWVDTDEEGGFKITVNGIAPDENGNIEIEITDPYVLPVGGEALGGVKNGGNVVIDATGAMNVEVPSIEGLATEEYVDAAIEAIPKVEVNYPVTSVNGQTGDVVVDVPSIDGLATETYVNNAIDNIEMPEVPVKSVNGMTGDVVIEIPEINYPVTSVNGQNGTVVLDAASVGALPDTTVIPTVPTNVSAFTNDAGYLTEHQSLDGLATEEYVNSAITNINTYYTKAEIDNMEFITVDEIDAICARTIEVVTPTTGTF